MMESPASTAGFVPSIDVDPWDWTIEEVVTALCSPEGELRTLEPNCYPEPVALAQAIRENHLRGKGLIRHDVDRAFLRDYLGIKAAGWQNAVLDTITQLRTRSPKFRDTIQMEASSFAVPSHSVRSHFGSVHLPHNARFNAYASAMDAPLARYLMEPMQPQQLHRFQKSDSARAHGLALNDHSGLPQTPLRTDADDVDNNIPQEGLVSSEPATIHFLKHLFPGNENDATDTMNGIGNTLRAGETHIVDATGRKRRRLDLSNISTKAVSGPQEVNLIAPAGSAENIDFDVPLPSGDMPTFVEVESHAKDDLQPSAGVSSSPLQPPHSTESRSTTESLPEPGTVIVDAEGRKRMRPILVQEPSDVLTQLSSPTLQQSAYADKEISGVKAGAFGVVSPNEIKTTIPKALGRRKMGRNQPYLGLKALEIDEIFYGSTRIEEEVRYPDQYTYLMPIKGPVEGTENWTYFSDDVYGAGLRIYLNNRIKYQFLNNQLVEFQRGKDLFHIQAVFARRDSLLP